MSHNIPKFGPCRILNDPLDKKRTYQEKIEDGSVGQQRPEDKKHAGYHPRRDGRHALRIWRDIGDGVKNVNQH